MLLNLQTVLNGAKPLMEERAELDFSQLEIAGEHPFSEPVAVQATVKYELDCVHLFVTADTTLHTQCARCGIPLSLPMHITFENPVVRELANENSEDDVIVLEGNELDVDELVLSALILNIEQRYLCRPDCKGICPQCGTNLNEHDCKCKKDETDPRLAILKTLLKK